LPFSAAQCQQALDCHRENAWWPTEV